jgi:hypothetical protein
LLNVFGEIATFWEIVKKNEAEDWNLKWGNT